MNGKTGATKQLPPNCLIHLASCFGCGCGYTEDAHTAPNTNFGEIPNLKSKTKKKIIIRDKMLQGLWHNFFVLQTAF